jgi:hypothetical protein
VALADGGVQYFGPGQYPDFDSRMTGVGSNVGEHRAQTEFLAPAQGGGRGWQFVRNRDANHAKWYGHGQNCAGIMGARIDNDPGSQIGGLNDVAGIFQLNYIFPVAWKHTVYYTNGHDQGGTDVFNLCNALNVIGASKRVYNPYTLFGMVKGAQLPHYNIEVAVVSITMQSSNWVIAKQFADLAPYILFCQPAGNYGTSATAYPAAYPGVLAVASYESDGHRSSYSSYGSWVDVAAPTNLKSTDPIGYSMSGYTLGWVGPPYELNTFRGTSCAGPVAAGVAALVQSKYQLWTPAQVSNRLISTRVSLLNAPELPGRIDAFLATQ